MIFMFAAMDVPAAVQPAAAASAAHAALMAKLKLECRDAESVIPTLTQAIQAEKVKDWPTAKTKLEAVIQNCGATPAAVPPRAMRAELAWRDKDYAGVLVWLKDVPRVGPRRLNLLASMLAMEADEKLGDKAAFGQERGAVEAAQAHALSSGGQKLGAFSAGGSEVTAYSVHLQQGSFLRLMLFTVSPHDPMAMPESVMLTDDLGARMLMEHSTSGQKPPYFVDAYTCANHVTVKMIPGRGDQPPAYEDVQPLVKAYLDAKAASPQPSSSPEVACAWPQFVAPGLTP